MKTRLVCLAVLIISVLDSIAGYDPSIGRWLSRDPILELGGVNIYRYVDNNPINYLDLDGLEPVAFTVVTVIRKPDVQAGVKTQHSVTVETDTAKITAESKKTGHTNALVIDLPARNVTIGATSVRCPDGVSVNMIGEAGSMLYPIANINYNVVITYNPKTGKVSIEGEHDGYPSYEIYKNSEKVYDHQQGNLLQLSGSGDVKIKQ